MPHVRWSRAALADLDRIYAFFAKRSRRAALDAVILLNCEVLNLEHFPRLGRATNDSTQRELTVRWGSGGFVVLYAPTDEWIEIARVRHSRQRNYPAAEIPAN